MSRLGAINFDLWGHRATRRALLATAALFGYGALDSALRREAWAEYSAAYYLPHLLVGAFVLMLSLYAMARVRAPNAIPGQLVAVLAILLGFGAVVASYSAMIRVNQLAGGPLETRHYKRSASCDALVPVEPALPTIEYSGLAVDYWCRFSPEALHEVQVRRGLFGLYQVDLTLHTKAIRRYRAGQARGEKKAAPVSI